MTRCTLKHGLEARKAVGINRDKAADMGIVVTCSVVVEIGVFVLLFAVVGVVVLERDLNKKIPLIINNTIHFELDRACAINTGY